METCSRIVPNTSTSKTGDVRVSVKTDLRGHVYYQGCQTLHELFQRSCMEYKSNTCLGERLIDSFGNASHYVFKRYEEINDLVIHFASGLIAHNLLSKKESSLGIYMKNNSKWIISEHACYYINAITVPLYDTLGPEAIEYIINHVELQTIICSPLEVDALLKVKDKCPSLRHIIVTSEISSEIIASAAEKDIRVYTFDEVVEAGRRVPTSPSPPSGHDTCTICYTSGTTGPPKGAIISHANLICAIVSGIESFIKVTEKDYYLSFLPLAHIFERLSLTAILSVGGSIGFYQGNPLLIIDDLKALQPTVFCAVPRLLNRIYDKILQKTEDQDFAAKLLKSAVNTKLNAYHKGNGASHIFFDMLIFSKIKTSLGLNRVKRLLSGGAPCSASVMAFFRILLGATCSCHEGYGQTETSGATTMTEELDTMQNGGLSHVGCPFPSLEIRLADIPDMNYLHTDRVHSSGETCQGRGEIQVRGPHVFGGYYRAVEETRDVLDADGWLSTGDVGIWTELGQLAIVDRKKNIFKLSQGEYIEVEKVENVLMSARLVAQLFVHGDSNEDSLVAIVVPDIDTLRPHLLDVFKNEDIATMSLKDLCELYYPVIKQSIMFEFTELAAKCNLKGYEMVKNIFLDGEMWVNVGASSILTPTMKLKRNLAKEKYAKDIKKLYSELRMNVKAKL